MFLCALCVFSFINFLKNLKNFLALMNMNFNVPAMSYVDRLINLVYVMSLQHVAPFFFFEPINEVLRKEFGPEFDVMVSDKNCAINVHFKVCFQPLFKRKFAILVRNFRI